MAVPTTTSLLPISENPKRSTGREDLPQKSISPILSPDLLQPPTDSSIVEEYKAGYPQFTALLSSHTPFFLFRRFSHLRARVLLLKQDKLSMLEQRLKQVDDQETALLFLGNSRRDQNATRAAILTEIEAQLADYDHVFARSNHMLSLKPAPPRDIRSLQNWLDGNGCLARDESAYLEHARDLVTLAPPTDDATTNLETWVEDRLIHFHRGFRTGPHHDVSDDPNVYIYSGPLIRRTAKAILLSIIILFLLLPIVLCSATKVIPVRVTIVILFTISYLVVLSLLTTSRTMELMLAGATYATVLTVFVSGGGIL